MSENRSFDLACCAVVLATIAFSWNCYRIGYKAGVESVQKATAEEAEKKAGK